MNTGPKRPKSWARNALLGGALLGGGYILYERVFDGYSNVSNVS